MKLLNSGQSANTLWRSITNPISVISTLVLLLALALLAAGHYCFYRMVDDHGRHNIFALSFFVSCLGLMCIYFYCYVAYFAHRRLIDSNFEGGYVSARTLLRQIAVMTAVSFAIPGYEILSLDWYVQLLDLSSHQRTLDNFLEYRTGVW